MGESSNETDLLGYAAQWDLKVDAGDAVDMGDTLIVGEGEI